MKIAASILAVVIVGLAPNATWAAPSQTVHLLDGSTVQGSVVGATETSVTVKTSMGELTIAKDKLLRIDFGEPVAVGGAAPVGTSPVSVPAEVRSTSNPSDVIRCTFVATVKSTGLAGLRERSLRSRAAEAGANVVFIPEAGNALGEAFLCGAPKEPIEVVEDAKVTRSYKVVGFASSKSGDPTRALDEMRVQAMKQGGEALLGVATSDAGTVAQTRAANGIFSSQETRITTKTAWSAKVITWTK